MSFKRSALLAAASLGVAGIASAAPSIGVKYVDNGNAGVQSGNVDSLGAAESAGAPGFVQSNWNNMGRWGQTVGVNDSTGAVAAGVTTTWDSNNTWRTGSDTTNSNGKLMYGYLDSLGLPNNNSPFSFFGTSNAGANDNRPIAYVTGLSGWLASQGATKYSVVAYVDGDGTDGRRAEYWLQSASGGDPPGTLGPDLSSHVFVNDTSNFSGTFTQVPLSANTLAGAVEGNYIVFTGLSADSFLLRSEEQSFRSAFNGFQIVAEPVPEPASLGLIAVGAARLLARRHRHCRAV